MMSLGQRILTVFSILFSLRSLVLALPTNQTAHSGAQNSTPSGNPLTWEKEIGDVWNYIRAQTHGATRYMNFLAIEMYDVDGLTPDMIESSIVTIATRNVATDEVYLANHYNTEGFYHSTHQPEGWEKEHEVFLWQVEEELRPPLTMTDALALAGETARALRHPEDPIDCTISVFDFMEDEHDVHFLFRYDLRRDWSQRGAFALAVNARSRAVVTYEILALQPEETWSVDEDANGLAGNSTRPGVTRGTNGTIDVFTV